MLRAQVITTVAGTDWIFPQGSMPALNAPLDQIYGVATDSSGNIYAADYINCVIAKITLNGTLTLVAGNGICAYGGDGGQAVNAGLFHPTAVAVFGGIIYIRDYGRIRKVSANGIISTIAGNGTPAFTGDGGPAAQAQVNDFGGLAVDGSGNLFLSDSTFNRVREIDGSGNIRTIAGSGATGFLNGGFSGDGGPGTSALLNYPLALAFDPSGNLLIADQQNSAIRKLTPGGIITTAVRIDQPSSVAVDSLGNIYTQVIDGQGLIYKIAPNGQPVVFAGNGHTGFSGDGGPALSAALTSGVELTVDPSNNLIIGDQSNLRVRKITGTTINTVAGNGGYRYNGENVPGTLAPLNEPWGLALDSAGRLYFSEMLGNRVRRLDANGLVSTFAGIGLSFSGGVEASGVPAASGVVFNAAGLVFDSAGDLFIGDNSGLREVNAMGTISTFTPTNSVLFAGVAIDSSGALYATDGFSAAYKVGSNGVSTRIAGVLNQPGFSGDGGKAANAALNHPNGIAVDSAGKIYIADTGSNRVRVITPDGMINTFAGTGSPGAAQSGVPPTAANLSGPQAVAVDASGNVYIADFFRVWKVIPNGTISIIAGTTPAGYSGDGGEATNAELHAPYGVLPDAQGNIYIADSANNRVRKILATPPTMAVDQTSLAFSANSGGAVTSPQNLSLSGSIPGLLFTTTVNTLGTGNWLTVTPSADRTPRLLQVVADPSKLPPGAYTATITIAPTDALPAAIPVNVTFTVGPALAPQFGFDKSNFSFTYASGSAARTGTLTVSDAGGGQISFTATPSTNAGGAWLSISPSTETVTPNQPAKLTIAADPAGLAPGTYTGTIRLTAPNVSAANIPVVMTISSFTQAILLSQTGLSFTVVNSGGAVPSQTFAVLNAGSGAVNFSVTTSTLSGGQAWLSATPNSGTTGSSPSIVTVSVNGTSLPPGAYYGQVSVTAPGAANSPQVVTVFLAVLPPGSNPGALIQPAALVFPVTPGTGNPSSQNLQIFNLSGASLSYRTIHTNAQLVTALPGDATLPNNQPLTIVVQPTIQSTGTVTSPVTTSDTLSFQFSDGRVQSVPITVIFLPGPVASSFREGESPRASGGCTPTQLMPSLSTLGQSFSVTAGWPVALGVNVQDDCGNALNSGSVTVSFSDGSPPISLQSLQNGTWQATWQTQAASLSTQVTLTINAADSSAHLTGTRQITGGFRSQQDPPILTPGSVVSAASPVAFAPLAPGGMISIYGQNLADDLLGASMFPLPMQLGNAQVLIAGHVAPLLYASSTQINAIVPVEVNTNTVQQVLVQRGVTYSQPVPVNVAASQPAVFGSGTIGVFVDTPASGAAPFVVTADAPATANDVLVAYCAGLGPTTPAVGDGTASPASPPAATVNQVTVTIGGVNAPVFFAGLTPGLAGLYQINLVVPGGIQPGNAVPVIVTVAGQTGPSSSIPIH